MSHNLSNCQSKQKLKQTTRDIVLQKCNTMMTTMTMLLAMLCMAAVTQAYEMTVPKVLQVGEIVIRGSGQCVTDGTCQFGFLYEATKEYSNEVKDDGMTLKTLEKMDTTTTMTSDVFLMDGNNRNLRGSQEQEMLQDERNLGGGFCNLCNGQWGCLVLYGCVRRRGLAEATTVDTDTDFEYLADVSLKMKNVIKEQLKADGGDPADIDTLEVEALRYKPVRRA